MYVLSYVDKFVCFVYYVNEKISFVLIIYF